MSSTLFEIKEEIFNKTPGMVITALTFAAAIAWNDGIQSLIDYYLPKEKRERFNAWFKIFYALALSIVIIILINVFNKLTKKITSLI